MSGTLNLKKWLAGQAINIPTKSGYGILFVDSDNKIKVKTDDGIITDYGKSAYDIWLELGNVGTSQDFIDSLKGDIGLNGSAGADGLSAYQIWLNAGNTGTAQDFLNSLVGADGQNINMYESDTPPLDPVLYPLWLDTSTAKLKVYFTDAQNFVDAVPTVKGDKGDSNVYALLSNNNTTFTSDNSGIVSDYTNGSSNLYVFEGNTELVYNPSNITLTNGQWNFSTVGTNITWGGSSVVGNHNLMAPPNSITSDNAYIVYTINCINISGVQSTFNIQHSFSKAKAGNQGIQGLQGIQGVAGVGLPTAGTTGQVLAKTSNNDFDTQWIDAPTGGTSSYNEIVLNQVITKQSSQADKVILSSYNQGIATPGYIDEAGNLNILQSSFIDKHVSIAIAEPNTASLAYFGMPLLSSNVGSTATAKGISTVSSYDMIPKIEYLNNTASTSTVAGLRQNTRNYILMNFTSSTKGLKIVIEGNQATGGSNPNKRFFMGLTSSTAAPTDIDPITLTNVIGICYSQNTTGLSIIHAGSGAATIIATGLSKPSSDRENIYQLIIENSLGKINMFVRSLITGESFSYSVTNIANSVPLLVNLGFNIWSSVGGTSAITGIGITKCYAEQRHLALI